MRVPLGCDGGSESGKVMARKNRTNPGGEADKSKELKTNHRKKNTEVTVSENTMAALVKMLPKTM